jgi:hypothetical protein
MSNSSLIDLLIIIPTFTKYNCAQVGLFFQSSSRLLRIMKATNVLKKLTAIGETDVSRKIFSLIIFLLVLMYISAGLFMVLENFNEDRDLLFN